MAAAYGSKKKPTRVRDLTPTQKRILAVLADGLPHTREELHACLWDEQSNRSTIQWHISMIRKVLRPMGQEIVCEFSNRTLKYRHIKLLKRPSKVNP